MAARKHVKLIKYWRGYRAGREFPAMHEKTAAIMIANGFAEEVKPVKKKAKRKAKPKDDSAE